MKLLDRIRRFLDPSIAEKEAFLRDVARMGDAAASLRATLASCEAEVAQAMSPPPPNIPVIYNGAVVALAWKPNSPTAQFLLWARPEGHA